MTSIYIDMVLCLTTYMILLGIIFWYKRKRNQSGDSDDDEGGLPIENGPKLDLPPGICLPGDGPTIRRKEKLDEMLA